MDRAPAPAAAVSVVAPGDTEVLAGGGGDRPGRRPVRSARLRALLGVGVAVGLVAGLAWQLAPQLTPAEPTGVALVLTGSQRGRLDADSGRFEAWPGPAGLDRVALPVATLAPGGRIPAGRTVVAAVDGGLLLRHGSLRDPVLQLYDPAAGRVVRTFDGIGWVLATGGGVMTASLPCWAGDCPVLAVDTASGRRVQLTPPAGTLFSGRPVPSADGRSIAAVVRPIGDEEARLAVGPTFGALHLVTGVVAEPGTTVAWGSGPAAAWVAVPTGDRRIQLWRPGAEPHDVTIPVGTSVVTVVPDR